MTRKNKNILVICQNTTDLIYYHKVVKGSLKGLHQYDMRTGRPNIIWCNGWKIYFVLESEMKFLHPDFLYAIHFKELKNKHFRPKIKNGWLNSIDMLRAVVDNRTI